MEKDEELDLDRKRRQKLRNYGRIEEEIKKPDVGRPASILHLRETLEGEKDQRTKIEPIDGITVPLLDEIIDGISELEIKQREWELKKLASDRVAVDVGLSLDELKNERPELGDFSITAVTPKLIEQLESKGLDDSNLTFAQVKEAVPTLLELQEQVETAEQDFNFIEFGLVKTLRKSYTQTPVVRSRGMAFDLI